MNRRWWWLTASLALFPAVAHADAGQCVAAADQAQLLRDDGKYRAARAQMLVCSNETCPTAIRRDCAQWLSDLERTSPSIVVSAKDGPNDITDVSVAMDGEVLTSKLDGTPIVVDAKEHVFRFERAGSPAQEQKLMITAGQKNRIIELQFAKAVVAEPKPVELPVPVEAPKPPKAKSKPPVLAYVLGGVGIAAIGTGAAFWLVGLGEKSDLEGSCKPNCADGDVSGVRTKLVIGDVAAGVGLVAVGAAAYLLLTAPSSGESAKASGPVRPSGIRFGAAPLPNGGGAASLGGSF